MHDLFEYFRATGAYEAVQGLSDLFTASLQNDDVRWDHSLLSVSEMPSDMILEELYKSKLQNSAQLQTVLALYDQETARNKGKPNYSQLMTAVKLHTRNFRVWSDGTRITHQESKGKKAYIERKAGECFQWKAHGQCSKGDSCSFSHDTVGCGNSGDGQRRKGQSSSPASDSMAKQTGGAEHKSSQGSGNREESSSDTGREIPCRFKICKKPRHASLGILPCVRITSLKMVLFC